MDFISVKEAAAQWGISERRVQKLCEIGKISGAEKFGFVWLIPKTALKPVDGRSFRYQKKECENDE
jgi:excisionase family DNA binding protein